MKHGDKPNILVIFGVTGNLAHRRLLPALYHLFKDDLLHDDTTIVGVSRKDLEVDTLLSMVEDCVLDKDGACDPAVMARLRSALKTIRLDPANPEDYRGLAQLLDQIETDLHSCANRMFYSSIPPAVYSSVVENLGQCGLNARCQHGENMSALLVEKPFGFDLESAEKLIADTNRYFDESQIFRIDHYLAKETAQNILAFRRHNPMFQPIWNSQHVSDIEVLTSETLDVRGRGAFYDEVGALRDQVQSHLMQLLALATFDIPDNITEDSIHQAKQALLESIEVPSDIPAQVTRGQYEGYLADVERQHSTTETYVAINLRINNDRWRGSRIRLATGKMLARKTSLIRFTFADPRDQAAQNLLTFRLQPNEGIDITLQVKKLGLEDATEPALLDLDYQSASHPDAYERVFFDAIRGDHMLFTTSAEVLATWRVLQPILSSWRQSSDDLIIYKPGEDLIS